MNIDSGLRRGLLFFILPVTIQAALAKEINPPLEAPIKLYQPAARATPAMAVRKMQRPVPAPSTPAAKYPQYQLGLKHRHDFTVHDVANPRLRFLLSLPDTLSLIEATITIDGQPFQKPRQRRIEQIMKVLAGDTADAIEAISNQTADARPVPDVSPSVVERLRHIIKLTGQNPSQEEVSWILSNWADGPTIMPLNDNFQRFRADQRPEIIVLDRNHNGTISAEEITMAAQSFQECDLNRDGIVQFTEIAAAANDPRFLVLSLDSGRLVTLLPDQFSSTIHDPKSVISKQSSSASPSAAWSRFDANGDGEIDADELRVVLEATPDLRLSITFDTVNPEKSRIIVVSAANEFEQNIAQAMIDTSGINMMFNRTPVIFSAAQVPSGDQISIGAVNDGYPLLPKLDPNDDGQLTIRELRDVPVRLSTFDKNHDGVLTADETQSPIRICIGLGASVHLELARLRSLRGKDVSVPSAGPEWFVRMDRNKDHDLTRGEFPGTDEQFMALDADGDQLISSDEATMFDKNAQSKDEGSARSGNIPNSTKSNSDSKNAPVSNEEKLP